MAEGTVRILIAVALLDLALLASPVVPEDCSRIAATSAAAHIEIGSCFSRLGRWREAETHYRRAGDMAPGSIAAVVGHAQALVYLDQPYEALTELEVLLEVHQDAVPALRLYAVLLAGAFMDTPGGLKALERCVELAPFDAASWVALAGLQFEATMSSEAARSYQKAIEITGEEPVLIARLARCQADLGQDELASLEFQRAVRLNRQASRPSPEVYLLCGDFLLRRDRFEESISVLTEALALDASNADARFSKALAYEKLGELRKAETEALAALRESGERIDARNLLRRIYRALDEPEKAAHQARLISQLSAAQEERLAVARSVRTALAGARRLLEEGAFRGAAERYEEVVRLAPKYSEGYFVLGVCYSQSQRPEKAEESFREYVYQRPYLATGHAALGVLLLEKSWFAEAAAELERALELEPEFGEAREALDQLKALAPGPADAARLEMDARAALDRGDYQAVARLLESSALSEREWSPELYTMLATARLRLQRTEQAVHLLARGVERHPSSKLLADAYLVALESLPAEARRRSSRQEPEEGNRR
jgi:tetratricopeptide (TPR) repeat protein